MITISNITEIINEPFIKIRGFVKTGEYFEIRFKNDFVDVRLSKEEFGKMKTIFRQKMKKEDIYIINVQYIINYLGIIFEDGDVNDNNNIRKG